MRGCERGAWFVVAILVMEMSPAALGAQTRPRTPIATEAPQVTFAAGISVGLALALSLGDPALPPLWAGNPLDDGVRDGLRLHALDARRGIALASDVLVAGLVAFEGILDALVTPLVQDDAGLAWQATAAYTLALGVTLSVDELVKVASSRERPTDPGCDATPTPAGCTPHARGSSFFSGHSATGFASAGFSCAMHLERALYGDAVADAATCGGTLLAAAVTGAFRIMGDQHYLTDVIVGAGVGFVIGYLAPLFFVPRRATHEASGPTVVVLPTASAQGTGLSSLGLSALGAF